MGSRGLPFSTKENEPSTDETQEELSEKVYYVNKIHGHRLNQGNDEYLVEWVDHPKRSQFTWEPKENIQHTTPYEKFVNEKEDDLSDSEDITTEQNETSKKRKKTQIGPREKRVRSIVKRKDTSKEKYQVASSQGWKCNLCMELLPYYFEIDHIQPIELEGLNEIENYQALCATCHGYKSSILDRTIITQMWQSEKSLTRDEILQQCRIQYMMRNKVRRPGTDPDLMSWSVSIQNVFNGMVQERLRTKEVEKEVEMNSVKTPQISSIHTDLGDVPDFTMIDQLDSVKELLYKTFYSEITKGSFQNKEYKISFLFSKENPSSLNDKQRRVLDKKLDIFLSSCFEMKGTGNQKGNQLTEYFNIEFEWF